MDGFFLQGRAVGKKAPRKRALIHGSAMRAPRGAYPDAVALECDRADCVEHAFNPSPIADCLNARDEIDTAPAFPSTGEGGYRQAEGVGVLLIRGRCVR
jgi:hypothetical protein